jgi:rusticyanin
MFVNGRRTAVIVSLIALGAAATGVGAVALGGAGSSAPATVARGMANGVSYSYYRSMMGRFENSSMMGGSPGSMMGSAGYRWMTGGSTAPQWMRGSALPNFMTRTSADPGKVMGSLFANAPGPRVSAAEATLLGNAVPAGASVDAADHTVSFTATTAHLVVLAGPSGNPDETFRIAGMVNPTITVARGTHLSIEVINSDPDTAHGLVITAAGASSSSMPMTRAAPAFAGSAVWFLGDPTAAGIHTATLRFTATAAGTYEYVCPVPGHAGMGMAGSFVVTG